MRLNTRMISSFGLSLYLPASVTVQPSPFYARAEDLTDYLNRTTIRGEMIVLFWLRGLEIGGGVEFCRAGQRGCCARHFGSVILREHSWA